MNDPAHPTGCFRSGDTFYFNLHPAGAAAAGETPYCRARQSEEAAIVPMYAGSSGSAFPYFHTFRQLGYYTIYPTFDFLFCTVDGACLQEEDCAGAGNPQGFQKERNNGTWVVDSGAT